MTMADRSPALIDGVNPDVYRENAFRILGLRVDATRSDIRRQVEALRVALRFDEAGTSIDSRALPLDPPPGLGAVEEAAQRLRHPVRRLVDELFWFWPLRHGETDDAIAALDRGDIDAAESQWRRQAESPEDAPVAVHNLAVLAHARALDKKDLDRELWKQALAHWKTLVDHPEFWVLVDDRLDAIDDARLNLYSGQRIRLEIPSVLFSINAKLSVRAVREGRLADAAYYIELIRESGFGSEAIDGALILASEPDADRVRTLCKNARDAARDDPHRAVAATRNLLGQAKSPLDVLSTVLPPDHPILLGARDEVVLTARQCAVGYANKTKDWATATDLLAQALAFEATPAARDRVSTDLDTVKGNLLYARCWFCKENPSNSANAYGQMMYGDVNRQYTYGGTRTTWRKTTISVPRCEACAASHSRKNSLGKGLGCGGALIAVALGIGAFAGHIPALGIVLLVLAMVVYGIGNGSTAASSVKAVVSDFPPIEKQLAKGWKLGAKPPNT